MAWVRFPPMPEKVSWPNSLSCYGCCQEVGRRHTRYKYDESIEAQGKCHQRSKNRCITNGPTPAGRHPLGRHPPCRYSLPHCMLGYTPCGQTDTCENITIPRLLLWVVTKKLWCDMTQCLLIIGIVTSLTRETQPYKTLKWLCCLFVFQSKMVVVWLSAPASNRSAVRSSLSSCLLLCLLLRDTNT